MTILAHLWTQYIQSCFAKLGYDIPLSALPVNNPPDISTGDFAYPMFPAVKQLADNGVSMRPDQLAQAVEKYICEQQAEKYSDAPMGSIRAAGPYINVFLDRANSLALIESTITERGSSYGSSEHLRGKKVTIEFSAPNTNKPLHIGHLRNDAIGESVSRLLSFCGAQVRKVNLVNDRGMHICKSMLAYQKFGKGKTPQSEHIKSDHFVGDYYVAFANWAKKDEHAEQKAQEMLVKWEQGDKTVHALWNTMNTWALEGIFETYKNTGIQFDCVYKESKTYLLGKQAVEEGLEQEIFYKDESNAVLVDLSDIKRDTKILLRSDGTSVYITQDLGTAQSRFADWPCDEMVYVVAHEQNYHFTVLFHILKKMGFEPAVRGAMKHLGYGMVHLPQGRMKSREGTVVDADDVLNATAALVEQEIRARGRDKELHDTAATARAVALGAVHYFLLNVSIKKDVLFDPEHSISFQGNTGPYIQYTCARIAAMLRKFPLPDDEPDWALCGNDDSAWQLCRTLSFFSHAVLQAAKKYDPSVIASYAYECAGAFSTFYQSVPIATCDNLSVKSARMRLSRAVLQTLRNALTLLNIPYLEKM